MEKPKSRWCPQDTDNQEHELEMASGRPQSAKKSTGAGVQGTLFRLHMQQVHGRGALGKFSLRSGVELGIV